MVDSCEATNWQNGSFEASVYDFNVRLESPRDFTLEKSVEEKMSQTTLHRTTVSLVLCWPRHPFEDPTLATCTVICVVLLERTIPSVVCAHSARVTHLPFKANVFILWQPLTPGPPQKRNSAAWTLPAHQTKCGQMFQNTLTSAFIVVGSLDTVCRLHLEVGQGDAATEVAGSTIVSMLSAECNRQGLHCTTTLSLWCANQPIADSTWCHDSLEVAMVLGRYKFFIQKSSVLVFVIFDTVITQHVQDGK